MKNLQDSFKTILYITILIIFTPAKTEGVFSCSQKRCPRAMQGRACRVLHRPF
jgi:hypothetical protein